MVQPDLERPTPESYWVIPNRLLAGPYPGSLVDPAAGVLRLLKAGVDFFLDLTEKGEVAPYAHVLAGAAVYQRMPIPDFDTPSVAFMAEILDTLDEAVAAGRTVYLHCLGGLGRTGTVVGCWLVRHGTSGPQALRTIRTLRQATPCPDVPSPQTAEQCRMVLNWQR